MYFRTNDALGEPAVCEAAAHNLERLATSLKLFKKEADKTHRDPKRFKNIGALVVGDADTIVQNLADYMDSGCCDAELRSLEAQVQSLPWTFQRTHGTKIVRVERFGEIIRAHANLIAAIKQARNKTATPDVCNPPSPGGPGGPGGSGGSGDTEARRNRQRYITTRLAEPATAQTFRRPFDSAERDVTENDGQKILTMLGGPSPWQQFLRKNLDDVARRGNLPAKPLRICDDGEFKSSYRKVFVEEAPEYAQGFVNRRAGMMVLREFPPTTRGKTKVGLALHEAVHLFSHPAGKSNAVRGTAYVFLGPGLLEGLTQLITEDIMDAQGLQPLRSDWQAYKDFTPVARKFVQTFGRQLVGDAFFNGRLVTLASVIHSRWGKGLKMLKDLTNAKQKDMALRLIDRLNSPRP